MILHWSKAIMDINVRMNQYARGGVPEFIARMQGPEHFAAILYALFFQMFHRWPLASAVLASLAFSGVARAIRGRSLVTIAGAVHAAVVVLGLSISSRAFLLRNYLVVVPVLVRRVLVRDGVDPRAHARSRPSRYPSRSRASFARVLRRGAVRAGRSHRGARTDARSAPLDWISARATKPSTVVAAMPDLGLDEAAIRANPPFRAPAPEPRLHARCRERRRGPSVAPRFHHGRLAPRFLGRGDVWPRSFRSPGYRDVAHFDSNPYEHNFDVTPTWMGRFNVIVLQRE